MMKTLQSVEAGNVNGTDTSIRKALKGGHTTLRAFMLAITVGVATLAPSTAAARDTAPTVSDTLEDINAGFRALYHERTQQVLEQLPLVLVVQNDTITAVRGNQRRLYPVPLQRYNEARAVVHAVLGFHGLMGSIANEATPSEGRLSEQARGRVQAFASELERVRRLLPHTTLSPQEKTQARMVLNQLVNACHDVLASGSVSTEWIATTLRPTEAPLFALAESVGNAHVAAMQGALKRAQADATAEEWANAVAVVTGPMTPRRNNLETAIVASVMGPEHLGTRIFYSENIFSVDGALAYLKTLVGDKELSEHVFGKPYRMWEDLFAPVSRGLVSEDFYTDLPK